MAAPQFESRAGTNGSTATSASVSRPPGTSAGDLLLLHVYVEAAGDTPTVSGFTALSPAPASGDHVQTALYKIAGGSEPSSYTVSWDTSTWFELEIQRFSGVDPDDPTEGYDADSGSGSTMPELSCTTTGPDRLLVWAASNYQMWESGDTWTVPSGWTEREGNLILASATREQAGAGTVSDIQGSSSKDGSNSALVLALRPIPEEPTTDTLTLYLGSTNYDLEPTAPTSEMWVGVVEEPPIRGLRAIPDGATYTTGRASTVSDPPYSVEIIKFLSGPASSTGQLAAEDWSMTMARRETAADANITWAVAAWVMRPDGTRRAQAVADDTFSVEWPAVAAALDSVAETITIAGPGSAVDVEAGDRVVVEVGYVADNDLGEPRSGYIIHGGSGTTELEDGDTGSLLTQRPAFLQLPVSPGLLFADPAQYARPPATRLDLTNWKITLPTEDPQDPGDADEITQPELSTYVDEHFYLDLERRMTMVAPTSGDVETTGGSSATRCELREMEGGDEAGWNMATTGERQLTVSGVYNPTTITGGTQPRQEIIIGQIHGPSGTPPTYLAVEFTTGTAGNPTTPRLRVYKDGPGVGNTLSPLIVDNLIQEITYRIWVGPDGGQNRVKIYSAFGGAENLTSTPDFDWAATEFTEVTSECYFKAGSYNKTTVASGSDGAAVAHITYLDLVQPQFVTVTGTATATLGALSASASGVGVIPEVATGAGTADLGALSAAASGVVLAEVVSGQAAAQLGAIAAAASGVRTTAGAAVASLGALDAAADGSRTTPGSASAAFGFTAHADGQVIAEVVTGTGSASLGFAATATGTRATTGSAASTLGALSANASATRTTTGSAASSLGSLSATADGTVIAEAVYGTGTAELSSPTSSAAGVRTTHGQAAAPLGSLSAQMVGAGASIVTGSAAADLGVLTATATGEVIAEVVEATATAALEFTATAAGTRSTTGSATAALGGLDAHAAGEGVAEVITGQATAPLGFTASADGIVIPEVVTGTASADLGGLDATASGEGVARVVTGAASASLGALSATADGVVIAEVITGSGAAPLGGLTATTGGLVEVLAVATAPIGFTTGAAGIRAAHGQAFAPLGALVATAGGDGVSIITGDALAQLGALTATATGTGFTYAPHGPDLRAGEPAVGRGLYAGEPHQSREVYARTPDLG